MAERNFAFEQVGCELPLVKEEVVEMREESGLWRIEWEDGTVRETTWVGMAWYAKHWDDEATVEPL